MVESDKYDLQREVYDVIHRSQQNHAKEVDRLLKRARGAIGVQPDSWLDCACGTGLHLAALQRAGITNLSGFDNSAAQLQVARENLSGVSFNEADLRDFNLPKPENGYQVVSCLLSSVGHLHADADYLAALNRMAAHVSDRGVVMLEPWIALEDYRTGRLECTQAKTHSGDLVQTIKHSLVDGEFGPMSRLDFRWLLSERGHDVVRDWTMTMDLRLRSLDEQLNLFRQVFASVEHQSTGAGSRSIILARRPL